MSKLLENDFREANKSLIENQSMLSFFNSYGINVETLRLLLVGMDDNGNVIMPIMTHKNRIVGTLTIFEIERNGGIYNYSCNGFVGAPYSKTNTITIAKNIIDLMLLWQQGIDSVAVMTDRDEMPYIRFYKTINLVDSDDDIVDGVMTPMNSYDIKDLPVYLSMHKTLPELRPIDNKEAYENFTKLPFILDNKVFVMYKFNGFLIDSTGKKYASKKIGEGNRKFTYEGTDFYFLSSAWSLPQDLSKIPKSVDIKEVYQEVWEYVYTNLTFMSYDQTRLIALYILYMWAFFYRHPLIMHLHIIDPSLIQSNIIYQVLKKLSPNDKNLMHAPKTMVRKDTDLTVFYKFPYIYVDQCVTPGSYDLGPKILVDENSCDNRGNITGMKRVPLNKAPRIREKLTALLFNYTEPMEEDLVEGLYPYMMPFYQVGLKLGFTYREIKDMFYTVCGFAQRKFKHIDLKEYIERHSTKFEEDSGN